jgi:hypothetical protein
MVEGWKEGAAIYGWGPRTEIELEVDLGLACAAIMEENECSDEERTEEILLAGSVAGRRDGDSKMYIDCAARSARGNEWPRKEIRRSTDGFTHRQT